MLRNKLWVLFLTKTESDITRKFLLMAEENNSLFEDGQLTVYFQEVGISFFVIGAPVRNIIMELHNETSGRFTYDLDIAFTINDWEQWRKVEDDIINLENLNKKSESILINQIIETHKTLYYEEVLQSI